MDMSRHQRASRTRRLSAAAAVVCAASLAWAPAASASGSGGEPAAMAAAVSQIASQTASSGPDHAASRAGKGSLRSGRRSHKTRKVPYKGY